MLVAIGHLAAARDGYLASTLFLCLDWERLGVVRLVGERILFERESLDLVVVRCILSLDFFVLLFTN